MKDLLLLLCRYPFSEKNRETLSRLIGEVKDWDDTVRLINAHGIIALAAYNIREARLEGMIPADAMSILDDGYYKSMLRNVWLTGRWQEVNKILCDAGIKHILLKGMALEHTVYGARGLRQMNDNDILISHDDSVRAWQLLKRNGFARSEFKSPLFNKISFKFGRHLPAMFKDGYVLEIHDTLFENEPAEYSALNDPFTGNPEIVIGESKALILPPEIHLKYLVSHFNHHALSGDCQLRLYSDLLILDPLINIDFPDQFIMDPIQSKKIRFLKACYKANIKSIEPKHRLRFLIGDTFPSLKWMKKRYNCSGPRAILYYPARILKIAWLL